MAWRGRMSSEKITPRAVWLEEGLKILTEEGPGALSIENMTRRTGKTKGSFYHHFNSREQYIEKLLEYYEEIATQNIILSTRQGATPRERLKMLTELTFRISSEMELSIRAWALYEPIVRVFQDRIDQKRLEYLYELYLETSGDPDAARTLAYRNYALYIGLQQVKHHHSDKELKNLLKRIFSDPNHEITANKK
jgi:AcrR family transcriptional regulator